MLYAKAKKTLSSLNMGYMWVSKVMVTVALQVGYNKQVASGLVVRLYQSFKNVKLKQAFLLRV